MAHRPSFTSTTLKQLSSLQAADQGWFNWRRIFSSQAPATAGTPCCRCTWRRKGGIRSDWRTVGLGETCATEGIVVCWHCVATGNWQRRRCMLRPENLPSPLHFLPRKTRALDAIHILNKLRTVWSEYLHNVKWNCKPHLITKGWHTNWSHNVGTTEALQRIKNIHFALQTMPHAWHVSTQQTPVVSKLHRSLTTGC